MSIVCIKLKLAFHLLQQILNCREFVRSKDEACTLISKESELLFKIFSCDNIPLDKY